MVIGILIALQINNWNERQKAASQLSAHLSKVNNELTLNINLIKFRKKTNDTLIDLLQESLFLLEDKNPENLSELNETLGALGTDYDIQVQLPNTESLIERVDLFTHKNDSLTTYLFIAKTILKDIEANNRFVHDQYSNSIEPFFNRNINYSQVAMPLHKRDLIQGGPKIDFSDLANSLELWNLLTFKLETCYSQQTRLENMISFLQAFQNYINKRKKA